VRKEEEEGNGRMKDRNKNGGKVAEM